MAIACKLDIVRYRSSNKMHDYWSICVWLNKRTLPGTINSIEFLPSSLQFLSPYSSNRFPVRVGRWVYAVQTISLQLPRRSCFHAKVTTPFGTQTRFPKEMHRSIHRFAFGQKSEVVAYQRKWWQESLAVDRLVSWINVLFSFLAEFRKIIIEKNSSN